MGTTHSVAKKQCDEHMQQSIILSYDQILCVSGICCVNTGKEDMDCVLQALETSSQVTE